MTFLEDDPRVPKSCDECTAGTVAGWDRTQRCTPHCFRTGPDDGFAVRALAIWHMVSVGEVTDQEGTVSWSIDWGALREGRESRHPLFVEDDPGEIFEAMLVIRSQRSRSTREVYEELIRAGLLV